MSIVENIPENQPDDAAKAARKAAKEAAKQAKEDAKQVAKLARQAAQKQQEYAPVELSIADLATATFGDTPIHMSQDEQRRGREFVGLDEDLSSRIDTAFWTRCHVHNVRGTSKNCFILLRDRLTLMQSCCFLDEEHGIPREFIKYANSLSRESIVEVFGVLKGTAERVTSASPKNQLYELHIERLFCVSRAETPLPLQVEDAMRADSLFAQDAMVEAKYVRPGRDTRFDFRYIDLRTPANQAIFRIRARVTKAFRDFLAEHGFLEIVSPKIIPGASEGGASVFKLDYFGQTACLAQSPQLYKQMAIAAGMKRVFEVGPVFRAESSHTHRHLCEFTGLDLEMEIDEHYHEVLAVLDALMKHIFRTVVAQSKDDIAIVRQQYDTPSTPQKINWVQEDFVFTDKPVVLTFAEGIQLLRENGYPHASPTEDLTTELELALGKLVREKHGTDFYALDKFPCAVRPFYTMPDCKDETYSNSYDLFMRGQEITSGAQRVHVAAMLEQQCVKKGVPPESIKDYVDSFRYGCPPHGGAGIGAERVVMLLLGVEDCRQVCLFPRTPERLSP